MTRQVSLILRMAALALIVLAFLPAAFAQYAAQVFGSGYARDCYEAVKDRKHDAVKALQTCDVALEQEQISERNRAATHVNRGILFMRGGQHDRAMADYRKGLAIAPGMPEAEINLGAALYYLGRFEEAVAALDRGIAVENIVARAAAYYNRAIALEQLGRVEQAYSDYKTALRLDPDLAPAQRQLQRFRLVPVSVP